MPLTLNGLAKLAEELGELQQVIGKRLAYWTTEEHPDGGPPLCDRMADEMGDVMAAIDVATAQNRLDAGRITRRRQAKRALFITWLHEDGREFGDFGVQAPDATAAHQAPPNAWAGFLRARLALVDEWTREGRSIVDIAADLCVDLDQVKLLQMTAAHNRRG